MQNYYFHYSKLYAEKNASFHNIFGSEIKLSAQRTSFLTSFFKHIFPESNFFKNANLVFLVLMQDLVRNILNNLYFTIFDKAEIRTCVP